MYKLRGELRAHAADVRGVAVSSGGIIATASRDHTVALWNSNSDMHEPYLVLTGHDHFVNALTFTNSGKLVSASSDKTLRVWDTKNGECINVLSGHLKAVCGVTALPSQGFEQVISSSWDQTARVWDLQSGATVRVLSGHQAAVWSAVGLLDGRFVTVGADKTVRLWSSQQTDTTASILASVHTDVVRDVVAAPTGGFTTVANDSSLVCWAATAGSFVNSQTIRDLHDGSYTYSVDALESPPGSWMFVTGGEDNAVRIIETQCEGAARVTSINVLQTIMHPGTVWSARFCPNGDFVSACSDGVARVFTRDPSAFAEPDVLAAFDRAVSERQVNAKVIGGVDVGKLPLASEALGLPGKRDGENKIVKTASGTAEVHMWSAAEQKWSKVGDVVDDPGSGASLGAKEINGKPYDFVFEVEIGEGGKKEKLGYNRGENPYIAAQRFIDDNEISQEFLDQVAQFIEQQVPAEALQAATEGPSDPLTGGHRYVPHRDGTSAINATQGDPLTGNHRYVPRGNDSGRVDNSSIVSTTRGDPLTGNHRYVPRGNNARAMNATQGDPLTGASRYVPGSSRIPEGKLPPPRKLVPHKDGFVSYKNTDQLDKIQQKLSDFNAEIARTNMEKALSMEEAQVFASSLIPKLKTRGGAAVVFDASDCEIVEKLLKWPIKYIFPVLDIARLVISYPSGGAYFFGTRSGVILGDVLSYVVSDEATGPVHIMGCRFFCNMFGNRVVAEVAKSEMDKILVGTAKAATSANRRARETYASLLINYAVLLRDSSAAAAEREGVLSAAIQRICGGEEDEEVLYRLMLALGTLISDDAASAQKGVELGAATAAAEAAPKSARLQQIALEIATIVAT